MTEIKEILKKHDIAGYVFLHTPGFGETGRNLTPSYSVALEQPGGGIRLKSKFVEDHKGNKEQQAQMQSATSNMLKLFGEMMASNAMHIIETSQMFDEYIEAEHGKGGFTSNEEFGN